MANPAKAAAPVRPRRKRRTHWLQRDWRLYLMLLIPIVWYHSVLLQADGGASNRFPEV